MASKNKSRKEYQHQYYLQRKANASTASTASTAIEKRRSLGVTNAGASKVIGSNSGGGYFNFAGPPKNGLVTEDSIMSQFKSWIFICSSVNAAAVASATLRLYAVSGEGDSRKFLHDHVEKDASFLNYLKNESSVKSLAKIKQAQNVVEIVDHPLLSLLQNVNPSNNNFETFETTSIYLDLVGNSYWYVARDSMGVPQNVWLLKSQNVKIIPGKNSLINGYVYSPNGFGFSNSNSGAIRFRPDEIIHFKTPNPNSIYYGLGCAQAVCGAVNRFNMMDESEAARLRNMGRPDFAVKYKNGKIDSSEIKKVEKMWNAAFGGPNKSGKIKVFDEDWDLETLGFMPSEMEYPAGRVWSLKEVAAAFGIPYSILDTSDVKKATSELSEYWYAKNSVLPRITRIEEKLNEKLIPQFDTSSRMFLLYDNPVPRDQAQLTSENNTYIESGVKTINEVRLSLQLPKYEDELYDEPFAKGKVFTDNMSGFGQESGSKPSKPTEETENPKPGRKPKPEKVEEEEE